MTLALRQHIQVMPRRFDVPWRKPDSSCVLSLPGADQLSYGNTIVDRSGSGNDGAITGAVWKRLPSGLWYLYFDGNDDYVDFGTGIAITTQDFSLLAWVNRASQGAYSHIFGCSAVNGIDFRIRPNYDATLPNGYNLTKDAAADAPNANTAITAGWHLIGVTFDNSEATANCQYYLDGVGDGLVNFDVDFGDSFRYVGITRGLTGDMLGSIALPRAYLNTILTAAQFRSIFRQERHLFGV